MATCAGQGTDRLLVLGQEFPVGADERVRGRRCSLQGAQIHLQRSSSSRQIRRSLIAVFAGARRLGGLARPGEDGIT
ncbi:hypothetical protein PF008_g28110 [Phytophthora fragariae]|uniref:Uncharacterized protein n=1 Tax=Phytophthora fragariae TaxID=53985 RepID=A0A6G0QCU3_9STRA|nr:hypothetical protein PF008_g28110 [Phytophthora fragariae]